MPRCARALIQGEERDLERVCEEAVLLRRQLERRAVELDGHGNGCFLRRALERDRLHGQCEPRLLHRAVERGAQLGRGVVRATRPPISGPPLERFLLTFGRRLTGRGGIPASRDDAHARAFHLDFDVVESSVARVYRRRVSE